MAVRHVKMTIGDVELDVELLDTPTADAIWEAVPFRARGNTWGDEVYFSTPVQAAQEPDARTEFSLGEIAFWPPGDAIAVLFGPTPASRNKEPRLASPGNFWGRTEDDVTQLRGVRSGVTIQVEKA